MTSLTKQKIIEKLENFQEHMKYLYQLEKEAKNQELFLNDFHLFGSTERYLQLSVQSIVDICHLIVIDLDLKRPQDNYEAISILFEKKVISENLAQNITKMLGLRNILVHEYGKIDRKLIYEILKNRLEDLEDFKEQIINFIKSKNESY